MRSSVDFPEPLRPMIPMNSPCRATRSTPRTAGTETIWRRRVSLPSSPLRCVRSVRGTLYRMRTWCATTVSGECSGGTHSESVASPSSKESAAGSTGSAEFATIDLLPSPEVQEPTDHQDHDPRRKDQPGVEPGNLPVDQHGA